MSEQPVLISTVEGVTTITLHRPERRNAMTPAMQQELIEALERAATDGCRVVLLRGSGAAFCSGLDLAELQKMAGLSAAEYAADAERIAKLFRTLYELPKPTVAVVHGPAIAGGAGLATLCDFTLATPEARFGYTEVRIGFVPALVSAYLTLQLGEKRARDLLLTGRIVTAQEALQMGLLTEVVAVDQLEERVQQLVGVLVENSPQSLAATKRLLTVQNKRYLDTALLDALSANAEARETHDFGEGIAAFLEKRKPNWGS